MKRLLSALACAAALAACATIGPLRSGIDLAGGDASVRPQDDLYRRINGTWLKTVEMPPDKSYIGLWEGINEKIQAQLREIVEGAAGRRDDADARRIADLYASFMDEAAVERAGVAPLAPELAALDAIASSAELARAIGRLDRLGVNVPLDVSVDQDARDAQRYVPILTQGGLGLPDRDYYLVADDARFAAARTSYATYLAALLRLSSTPGDAGATAAAVIALEAALARGQWTRVENRDPVKTYNRTEVAALGALARGFDWQSWLAATAIAGKSSDVIVAQPGYLATVSTQLAATPLTTWRAYLRTHLLHSYAPYLGKDFVAARFAFTGTALAGATENQPRWKRGIALVDTEIGESLGKLYVEKHFPPESKARTEQLVANLLAACRESIDANDWMGPATKREAQAKLALFAPKIGYPSRWIDYSTLEIRKDDLVGNVERAREFEWNRNVTKLGKPVDRGEWFMTPQTVNAYYNAPLNEIVFPASVLQPPLFDPRADDAANYGAIGATIGHEISHGFDDEGSQYDGTGNLRVWWTEEDRNRFDAKTKALVAQYSAFSPLPGYHVNGELTLGENIADNAGLEIAYKAYQISLAGKAPPVIGGYTGAQRFFIGWAQVWPEKRREQETIRLLKIDPHSPGRFRANGAAVNQSAYYDAFGVKPGDGMYVAPDKRVSIW